MPYVYQSFAIPSPMPAFLCLMRILELNIAQAQKLISKGQVSYQGQIISQKNQILFDHFELISFKPNPKGLRPIFENEHFALFDKPCKMLSHPKGRFNHHSLLDEVRFFCGSEANLVHRLDKETSGLVLIGKHKQSITTLSQAFEQNQVKKTYLALVRGIITQKHFCITIPIATQQKGANLCIRSITPSQRSAKSFKPSQTEAKVLGYFANNTLLSLTPHTGRTHQIRIHLASINHPILGDPLYGCEDWKSEEYLSTCFDKQKHKAYFGAERLMLHASELAFRFDGYDFHFVSKFDLISP